MEEDTRSNAPAPAGAIASGRIAPGELAFDIDGVVANTMRLFLDIVRDRYGINHIRLEDITCYNLEDCLDIDPEVITDGIRMLLQGDYPHVLQPMDGCRRVLERLGREVPRLLFVTARPNRDVITRWLHDLLSLPEQAIEVVATGSFEAKIDVLREARVGHFVEDRLETCFLLADAGIAPIVYRQPWNRRPHPFTEVGGWDDIEALLRFSPGS
ncbi:MAG: haloacid dehalogenase [Desulfobacterales bacterium]|nr:haloacid dehalogenase [Desulfobacterales bacterium]